MSTVDVPLSALIADCDADSIDIEIVLGGASGANVVDPFAAAVESWVSVFPGLACSIGVNVEAIVALLADTSSTIEDFTVGIDFAADSIVIEDVTG